jgi:hypothetical protein
MPNSNKQLVAWACLCAALIGTAACSPHRVPPTTVDDLMEDRVMLDGVLMKCDKNPAKARTDTDCLNARIAIDRLASKTDPAEDAKRNEEFERRREQLRLTEENKRREQEAKTKVDAYHLPVVPDDSTPAPSDSRPPIVGQTNP